MTDLNALAERLERDREATAAAEHMRSLAEMMRVENPKRRGFNEVAPHAHTIDKWAAIIEDQSRALNEAAQALRGMGWQGMDRAPQGQRILADVRYDPPHRYFGSGRVEIGTLDGIGWAGEGIMGEPVAWMPLPAARSALKERGGGSE